MKLFEKFLFVLLILVTINTFDFYSLNKWIVSLLLLLSAFLTVLKESRLKKTIRTFSVLAVIFLGFKLLFFG